MSRTYLHFSPAHPTFCFNVVKRAYLRMGIATSHTHSHSSELPIKIDTNFLVTGPLARMLLRCPRESQSLIHMINNPQSTATSLKEAVCVIAPLPRWLQKLSEVPSPPPLLPSIPPSPYNSLCPNPSPAHAGLL